MALKSLNSKGKIISLGEFKHTQELIKKRRKSGFIITTVFALLILGIWYVFSQLPPTGKVELICNYTQVTSPASGEVIWHAPLGKVSAGEHVATILVRFDANFEALIRQQSDRCSTIKSELLTLERQTGELQSQQHTIQMELTSQNSQLHSDNILLNQRQEEQQLACDRLKQSTRMWHLDAIKKGEYVAVQKACSEATHQLELAKLNYAERQQKIVMIKRSLELINARLELESRFTKERQALFNQQYAEFKKLQNAIRQHPEGFELSLFSPIDGKVVDIAVNSGNNVESTGVVVEIARPNSVKLLSYVECRYRNRISLNSRVLVKFGDSTFRSKITHISSTLQRYPKPLRNMEENPEARYMVIELDSSELPIEFANGEIGEAIFFKGR